MKKRFFPILFIAVTWMFCLSTICLATVEWNILDSIQLDAKPLDSAVSNDGLTAYILCEKKILIYSVQEKKISDTIPVTGAFSTISLAPDGETLLLTDGEKKSVSLLQVTPVYEIAAGNSPVIGKKGAPVNIFAFEDYQCPYCARLFPLLEQLLSKYPDKVNLVIKHYPLQMHKFARKASIYALAAANQGKYLEISRLFFQNFNTLTDEKIDALVKQVGLDMKKFDIDSKSPSINQILSQDADAARKVKVRGVPAIFINGRLVKNRSVEFMSQMIERELKK